MLPAVSVTLRCDKWIFNSNLLNAIKMILHDQYTFSQHCLLKLFWVILNNDDSYWIYNVISIVAAAESQHPNVFHISVFIFVCFFFFLLTWLLFPHCPCLHQHVATCSDTWHTNCDIKFFMPLVPPVFPFFSGLCFSVQKGIPPPPRYDCTCIWCKHWYC